MGFSQTVQVVLTVDVAVLRHTFAGIEILLIKRGKAPFSRAVSASWREIRSAE